MKTFFCVALLFAAVVAQSYIESADELPIQRVRLMYQTGEEMNYVRLLDNQKLSASALTREAASEFVAAKWTRDNAFWTFQDVITSKWVSAEETGKKSLRATRPHERTWEAFEVITTSVGLFVIKSKANGKYLTVTEFNTITAKATDISGATTFAFEYFSEVDPGPVLLRSIRQQSIGAGGLDEDISLPAPAGGIVTYKLRKITPTGTSLYSQYTLQSMANNKYLCYDSVTFVVSASCSDSDVNAQWSFLAGQSDNSDYVLITNDEGNFIKLDGTTLKVADMSIDVSNKFEIAENTALPDSTYVVNLAGSDYWTEVADDGISLTAASKDTAETYKLEAVDSDAYKYNIYRDYGTFRKYLTVSGVNAVLAEDTAADAAGDANYIWEVILTGNGIWRITNADSLLAYNDAQDRAQTTASKMSALTSWVMTDLTGKK